MPRPRIEKTIGPAKRELFKAYRADKALRAHNDAAIGKFAKSTHRPFVVTIRDKGKIVGGLVADTYWGWMYVNVLWVAERYRGKGCGQSLMEAAETEARKRGVRSVFLASFSFQAPKFYVKLGYRVFGRLADFPAGTGHQFILLTKAL
jgi:ribosomal protein S18 acetylase RimI-like enzyme